MIAARLFSRAVPIFLVAAGLIGVAIIIAIVVGIVVGEVLLQRR